MNRVKFSVFADLHYREGNWNQTAERLEEAGYSREEITDGILAAAKLYGYDGMAEALLEQ